MKKTIAAALALMLCMMLGLSAVAETAETPAPVTETQTEAVSQEAAEEDDPFLSWIRQGIDIVSDAVSSGWNKAGDAVTSGLDWLQGKITEWTDRAEAYMKEHQWDKKVEDAWNTLKEGAANQGQIAQEKLTEAYNTVRDWLVSSGETVDREVAEAVDGMAAAAGVAEAKLSDWYRRMEAYMTEKADLVTDAAREAWETIVQNAREAGSVAKEEMDQACDTLREWLNSTGEGEDSEAVQGLDLLEEQI